MDNLKRFIVIPICLLTACVSPRPKVEQLQLIGPQKQLIVPKQQLSESQQSIIDKKQPTSILKNKIILLEQRQEKTKIVSSWIIRGGMAAKNKSKGWSAAMNWTQHGPGSYQIRLVGPLGAGAVLIKKVGGTITFQDGPKKTTSSNADELLLQQTGIRLPVNNLYYWVRGLPAPGKVISEQHDQYNHLVQLRQSGYTITFGNYTSVKGIDLPGIVRLEGNDVMVKVVIKNWMV